MTLHQEEILGERVERWALNSFGGFETRRRPLTDTHVT